MTKFLKEIIKDTKFELTIDTKVFKKNIILKAAYCFLDKWYFLFNYDKNKNIILNFIKKDEQKEDTKKILLDFTDELLNTQLRYIIEKENKQTKDLIYNKALNSSIDEQNYISYTPENNQNDIDSEVDLILEELAKDPELKIQEEEIQKIINNIKK